MLIIMEEVAGDIISEVDSKEILNGKNVQINGLIWQKNIFLAWEMKKLKKEEKIKIMKKEPVKKRDQNGQKTELYF